MTTMTMQHADKPSAETLANAETIIVVSSRRLAEFDQNAAMDKGWCLVGYSDGMVGIDRDDDADDFVFFDDGAAAREHVMLMSLVGADEAYRRLCLDALALEAASVWARDVIDRNDLLTDD